MDAPQGSPALGALKAALQVHTAALYASDLPARLVTLIDALEEAAAVAARAEETADLADAALTSSAYFRVRHHLALAGEQIAAAGKLVLEN